MWQKGHLCVRPRRAARNGNDSVSTQCRTVDPGPTHLITARRDRDLGVCEVGICRDLVPDIDSGPHQANCRPRSVGARVALRAVPERRPATPQLVHLGICQARKDTHRERDRDRETERQRDRETEGGRERRERSLRSMVRARAKPVWQCVQCRQATRPELRAVRAARLTPNTVVEVEHDDSRQNLTQLGRSHPQFFWLRCLMCSGKVQIKVKVK
jgi:hypothetical protein